MFHRRSSFSSERRERPSRPSRPQRSTEVTSVSVPRFSPSTKTTAWKQAATSSRSKRTRTKRQGEAAAGSSAGHQKFQRNFTGAQLVFY
ncbi:uncharacterized protein V6R79_011929 [Siganus canaliculatus]